VGKEQRVPTKFVNGITYWPCLFGSSCSKAHYKCTVSFQTRRDLKRSKHILQVLKKIQSDEYDISTNKRTIMSWYSLFIGDPPICFGHLCRRRQGDKIIIVIRNYKSIRNIPPSKIILIIMVFLFLSPRSWPYMRWKHFGEYIVIKIYQNTIVNLLVWILCLFDQYIVDHKN